MAAPELVTVLVKHKLPVPQAHPKPANPPAYSSLSPAAEIFAKNATESDPAGESMARGAGSPAKKPRPKRSDPPHQRLPDAASPQN